MGVVVCFGDAVNYGGFYLLFVFCCSVRVVVG